MSEGKSDAKPEETKKRSAPEQDEADEQAVKKSKSNSNREVKKPPQFLKKQERVRIKVGSGEKIKNFSTTRQTLHVFPDSKIARMFTIDGGDELTKDEDGFYLLPDRNTEGFRYCLNYLRDKDTTVPSNEDMRAAMEEEAKFYGIEDLVKKLTETKKPTKKATLIFSGNKDFDGKAAGVEYAKLDVNNSSPFSFTFKLTFDKKPSKAQKQWVVFHKGNSKETQTPSLFLTSEKTLNLVLNNDANVVITSEPLEIKTEYNIACVFDPKAKTAQLYVDGKAKSEKFPDVWAISDGPLNVGTSESLGKKASFQGSMTSFSLHYTALAESAIGEVFA